MASEPSTAAVSSALPNVATGAAVPTADQYRPDQVERALFEIRCEQNLMLGAVAGVIAGAVGALLWAVVTVATMFEIGWLAVGIGFMVGAAVRWAGRGTTQSFGVVGAAIALASVLAGKFLTILGLFAVAGGMSYLQAVTQFDYSITLTVMAGDFSPIDLLFYGIAIWEGYRISIREITGDEIHERLAGDGVAPFRRA